MTIKKLQDLKTARQRDLQGQLVRLPPRTWPNESMRLSYRRHI